MGSLLNKFWWPLREHIGDDTLLSLLDGELSLPRTHRVQRHLERCWTCRARRDELENAIGRFVGYRRQVVAPHLPPPPRGREMFLAKLDEMIAAKRQPWWTHPLQAFRRHLLPSMSPIFASLAVVSVAATLLLLIWQRSLPPVSAQQFLEKAQVWDAQPDPAGHPGVIYQKVTIRTENKTLERSLYRDTTGKRKPRLVALDSSDEQTKSRVEAVGVDWQKPLSVTGFQDWRHRQPVFSDTVTRSGEMLLTLTTSVPTGPVASESLTVRADDFHPLGRTVEMRNNDRIEIAELNYAVLGWDDVNDALFEPLSTSASTMVAAVHLPSLPSIQQLDLAELQARLVLSRLNIDSVEQLEFSRTQTVVQVKGVVEDTRRKNILVVQLRRVPHIAPAIFSLEELDAHRNTQSAFSSVKVYSMVGKPSPLEQLFKAHGGDQDAVSQASQQLLDIASSIKRESRAIDDLFQRFASDPNLGDSGKAALHELVVSHTAKLQSALDAENAVIVHDLPGVAVRREMVPGNDVSTAALAASGDRNMVLCREFISGGDTTTQRSAEAIASDLLVSIQQLQAAVHRISDNGTSASQVP